MNPILSQDFRIPFGIIETCHVAEGIREALHQAERDLNAIVEGRRPRTYANTLGALEALQERLGRPIQIASHLMTVVSSPGLRREYRKVLPEFSTFYAAIAMNEGLWRAIQDFAGTEEAAALTGVKRRHLKKTLLEFRRGGADLRDTEKARFKEIIVELKALQTQFSDNVLDATNAFGLILKSEEDLAGLPESVRVLAKRSAEERGLDGYRFTLQYPSVYPFLQYSARRDLRRKMYEAMVNRGASAKFDNRAHMSRILTLRREQARMLGYRDYADYRLEMNMAGCGEAAVDFEKELFEKTLPHFEEEVRGMERFAHALGIDELQPWDIAYLIQRMRKDQFELDPEELRPYFPLDRVLKGLFEISRRLFGVVVTRSENLDVWDPSVEFYELHDEGGTLLGAFYTDLFPRESKRSGAWMNSLITGGPIDNGFSPHLGLIAANFRPPQGDLPALLTHGEVCTAFHEFGHLLHHLMSKVEVRDRAGTNVARDWVELPSQLMENWAWEHEALDLFTRHVHTGEQLPDDLFEQIVSSRHFMEALSQMQQLSYGTVDLAYHIDFDPQGEEGVIAFGQRVMEPFFVRPEFAHTNLLASFAHVFSGGYAAGYYSYKWSEVLDADAFARFRNEGIFNRSTGKEYVDHILSRGDSDDPDELFLRFMGRKPDVNALFERNLGRPGPASVAG